MGIRDMMFKELKKINARSLRVEPIMFSSWWMISVGRYPPTTTVALLLVTYLLSKQDIFRVYEYMSTSDK